MGERVKTAAVVAAAGAGLRMGAGENKVYLSLLGRPVLFWSLKALQDSAAVDWIVVVTDENSVERCVEEVVSRYGLSKVKKVVPGGATRRESVLRGLLQVPDGTELVVVHDGARPLASPELVDTVVEVAAVEGACIPAVEVVDTVKSVGDPRAGTAGEDGSGSPPPGSRPAAYVLATVDRERLRLAQTPQAFKMEVLSAALKRSVEEAPVTDDSQLVELAGMPVAVVEGCRENLKITYPSDLTVAESLLMERMGLRRAPGFRVGVGYDIHQVDPSRKLVLGGVVVAESGYGLAGHSDADVLVHALMDALLGAAGERDIGWWFPPSDPKWRDASSADMLKSVVELIWTKGYRISNVDSTVIAERPRLADYVSAMKERLAEILRLAPDEIGIKFTTNEGLDCVGAGRGIAAWAVALLERCA